MPKDSKFYDSRTQASVALALVPLDWEGLKNFLILRCYCNIKIRMKKRPKPYTANVASQVYLNHSLPQQSQLNSFVDESVIFINLRIIITK